MHEARTNEEWLNDLNAGGERQETAISDLRELLLRATLYFFHRNLDDFGGMNRAAILQYAEDCTQEALIAVMNHLSDFRGDSKFTTWAYKFAINKALSTARRERWNGISLDPLSFSTSQLLFNLAKPSRSDGLAPDRSVLQDEIRSMIQQVIEHELTERQRDVLIMMVFHEIPMDEVVRRLGTNRNAIYKMLHDARRKLKTHLQAHGVEVSELLALFGDSE